MINKQREIKVTKENVLAALDEVKMWRKVTPVMFDEVLRLLFPEVFEEEEKKYPCAKCGLMRTKAGGGTTFTVCDDCWDEKEEKKESELDKLIVRLLFYGRDSYIIPSEDFRLFKQQFIDLAKKEVDECSPVQNEYGPWWSVVGKDAAKQRLEGM